MAKQIDILCSESSLYNAWNIVKAKGAVGGIDGVSIQEFEKEKRKVIPSIYPLCSECYAHIEYIPPVKKEPVKIAVI